jgi:DNA-binding MltR family transcriptional regulator
MTKKEMLRDTMYRMFKDDAILYADMEDFITMWQSLADKWEIHLSDEQWDEFTEEINCVASNRQSYFNEIFDKFFNQ